jgi:hypothetical protein
MSAKLDLAVFRHFHNMSRYGLRPPEIILQLKQA